MNDLLGGLGGLGNLIGGIAQSVVPKDTPEGKLLSATTELSNLKKQETELLIEIGKQAYEQNPQAWPQNDKLKLVQQNIAAAEATLNEAKSAQEAADAEKAQQDAIGRCSQCGTKNPQGVKFCRECGNALNAGPKKCISCGAELTPGTRFCGECGANQES